MSTCSGWGRVNNTDGACQCTQDRLLHTLLVFNTTDCAATPTTALQALSIFGVVVHALCLLLLVIKALRLYAFHYGGRSYATWREFFRNLLPFMIVLVWSLFCGLSLVGFALLLAIRNFPRSFLGFLVADAFFLAQQLAFLAIASYGGWIVAIFFGALLDGTSAAAPKRLAVFRKVHILMAALALSYSIFFFIYFNISAQRPDSFAFAIALASLNFFFIGFLSTRLKLALHRFWTRFFRSRYNRSSVFSRAFWPTWWLHFVFEFVMLTAFFMCFLTVLLLHFELAFHIFYVTAYLWTLCMTIAILISLATIVDRHDDGERGLYFPLRLCCRCCFTIEFLDPSTIQPISFTDNDDDESPDELMKAPEEFSPILNLTRK